MARHGVARPGAGATPLPTDGARTDDERAQVKAAAKRADLLTRSLPKAWRDRTRQLGRAGITGPEAIEADWSVMVTAREHYLSVYAEQCAAAARRRDEAADLRATVAHLPSDDAKRIAAEARALAMERAQPDHDRAMQIVALLTDAARKAQDSLMVHRPSGHSRVHVVVMAGGVTVGGGASTYSATLTEEDEAIIREVAGEALPETTT